MLNRHQIERNIEHWQKLMTSAASADNEEMAELGIRELYQRVRKTEPEAIVWCDSPYQFAVIPAMVTNILLGAPWQRLMNELRAADPDSWKHVWDNGWKRLRSGQIAFLIEHIIEHSDMRPVTAQTKENALRRLELTLRSIARNDRVRPQSIKAKQPTNDLGLYSAPFDIAFYSNGMKLGAKIHQTSGLELAWNMYSFLAPFVGVFDSRMITRLVPPSRALLPEEEKLPEALIKQLDEAHQLCGQMERFSLDMLLWFQDTVSLPRRLEQTAFDPTNRNQSVWNVMLRSAQDGIKNENRRKAEFKTNPNVTHMLAVWVPYFTAFLPFATSAMFIDKTLFKDLQSEIETWSYLAQGAFAYNFSNNICYVCRKPSLLVVSELRRPHRDNGPVARWDDGFEVYAWKGIVLERPAIMDPDYITVPMINRARNSEIRRALIEIYGEKRFLLDANAEVVHEDECGTLYQLNLPGDEPLVMVRVRNSTAEPDGTYKHYFLRVPPTMRTAKEAVAWTFNLTESEYQPAHQT